MEKKNKIRNLLFLHLLLMLYSLTGIFSKLAAGQRIFSFNFIKFYSMEFVILFFYAIGWQQVIKRVSLTTAFINKSATILWGLIWGVVFFGETVTLKKIISMILVISGMIIYVKGDGNENE